MDYHFKGKRKIVKSIHIVINIKSHYQKKNITDLVELDNDEYIISFKYEEMIQFLKKKSKKITKTIKYDLYFSDSNSDMLLMNKNDLFLLGSQDILILDIQNKIIIKKIKIEFSGYITSIYKLSDNILLAGYWCNYIEQIEYDAIKKKFKVISKTSKKEYNYSALYETSSIAILKNKLIAAPFNNNFGGSSLIIYKYKY